MKSLEGSTRPVHTYSIVARQPDTGELGVAVQSHWFGTGTIVTWAEAGVGAVATQAFARADYGPDGLDLLRAGTPAPEAVRLLLAEDAARQLRQLALVDRRGRAAVHTGNRCIGWAGHHVGDGFSVQANMMVDGSVVPAMAASFLAAADAPLADRLLMALEAGEAAGGDLRGSQSAALLVVAAQPTGTARGDRMIDLRVDDHPSPVAELRRLYGVHLAYAHMDAGDTALEQDDREGGLRQYARAAELLPDSLEVHFWHALSLATNDRLQQALPLFRMVFAADPNWRELLQRLPAAGLASVELLSAVLTGLADSGDGEAD